MLEPEQLHQGSQYRQRPESTGMAETAVQIRRSHHHRSHLYIRHSDIQLELIGSVSETKNHRLTGPRRIGGDGFLKKLFFK